MIVKFKPTGQLGTIDDKEYDPTIYEKVETPTTVNANANVSDKNNKSLIENIGATGLGLLENILSPVKFASAGLVQAPVLAATSGKVNVRDIPILGRLLGMSDQELEKLSGNTFGERLKKAATQSAREDIKLASYSVPFGKGANLLTKAILPGATSSALYEASGEKATPESVVGAGITGGAMAGLLDKLLRLSQTGSQLRSNVLNPQVEASPKYASSIERLQKTAEKLGLKGSAKEQIGQLDSAFTNTEMQIKDLLSKQKTQALLKTAQSDFEKQLEKSNYLDSIPGYKEAKEIMLKRLQGIMDKGSTSAKSLYDLKSELRKELTKTFSKDALTPKEEVKQALYQGLKDTLDNLIPEIRPLNNLEHQMFEIAPGLVKNIGKGGLNIPVIGKVGGNMIQSSKDRLGRILQSTGNISELAGNIVEKGGAIASGQSLGQAQDTTQTLPQSPEKSLYTEPTGTLTAEDEKKDRAGKIIKLAMIADLKTGGKNIAKLQIIQKALGLDQGANLTGAEKQSIQQAQSGLNLVDVLESEYQKVQNEGLTAQSSGLGILGGLKGSAAALTQSSKSASAYEQTKQAFLSKLSRASGEKGVLTDQDIKRVEKAIPSFYDTPAVAAEKLSLIRQIIGGAIESKTKSGSSDNTLDLLNLSQ